MCDLGIPVLWTPAAGSSGRTGAYVSAPLARLAPVSRMGCVSSVPEDQIVFLRSFGKFSEINPPGLLVTCPMCREVTGWGNAGVLGLYPART